MGWVAWREDGIKKNVHDTRRQSLLLLLIFWRFLMAIILSLVTRQSTAGMKKSNEANAVSKGD